MKTLKRLWNKLLQNLSQGSKESLGTGVLDCCKLNSEDGAKKRR
jgi:hypothetical protein